MMQHGLEKFLIKKNFEHLGFDVEYWSFSDFEKVVDHCLSALSHEGVLDILPENAPYYGCLWAAGKVLAEEVYEFFESNDRTEALTVLEVGCGLGLPSIIAARLGASVCAVDSNTDALTLLMQNSELNGIQDQIELIQCDWRSLRLEKKFDLIIASDVLYEEYHAESLADVIARHLDEGGKFLICDPCRWHYQKFVAALEERGICTRSRFFGRDIDGKKFRFALIGTVGNSNDRIDG